MYVSAIAKGTLEAVATTFLLFFNHALIDNSLPVLAVTG